MPFHDRLRTLRFQKGFTQETLAEKLQVSRQAIAKWESGAAVPELNKLMAIGTLYQLTLDDLVNGVNGCAAHREPEREPQTEALIRFLLVAGAQTYAGKGGETAKPSRLGAHELVFEEGEYRYEDLYFGGQHFIGEETLYRQGNCVWGMNYCGRTLGEGFSGDFLKAALLLRPREMPYRGPKLYRDGRYTYHNEVTGDFGWFQGREAIYCDERHVFECIYHGGWVTP